VWDRLVIYYTLQRDTERGGGTPCRGRQKKTLGSLGNLGAEDDVKWGRRRKRGCTCLRREFHLRKRGSGRSILIFGWGKGGKEDDERDGVTVIARLGRTERRPRCVGGYREVGKRGAGWESVED